MVIVNPHEFKDDVVTCEMDVDQSLILLDFKPYQKLDEIKQINKVSSKIQRLQRDRHR